MARENTIVAGRAKTCACPRAGGDGGRGLKPSQWQGARWVLDTRAYARAGGGSAAQPVQRAAHQAQHEAVADCGLKPSQWQDSL